MDDRAVQLVEIGELVERVGDRRVGEIGHAITLDTRHAWPLVGLILPTYEEAGNVERVVRAALAALERAAPGSHRILVVDDDSPDGTGRIADALAAELPAVEVLHRSERDGLGPRLPGRASTSRCAAAPSSCSRWTPTCPTTRRTSGASSTAARDADLVLGSRYVPGGRVRDWGLVRRAISRLGGWYAEAVLGLRIKDLTGGFKCFRREVLEAIDLAEARSHGYVFQIELTYRALPGGLPRGRDPDHVPRPRAGAVEDVLADRAGGGRAVPRLRWGRRGRALGVHMRGLSHMR